MRRDPKASGGDAMLGMRRGRRRFNLAPAGSSIAAAVAPPSARAALRAGLAAAVALVALVALTGSARAALPVFESSFTCDGTTPCGSFTSFFPTKIAVDESTGHVYVIDTGNDAIEVFDQDGNYLSQILGSSTTAGSFSFNSSEDDVAVDNSGGANQGNVYVESEGSGKYFAFRSDGSFLWQNSDGVSDICGIGVDSTGSPAYMDYNNGLQHFDPADGSAVGSPMTMGSPADLCQYAFDSRDNIIARHYSGPLEKFDPSGTLLLTFQPNTNYSDVSIDTTTDAVYAVDGVGLAHAWSADGTSHGDPFNSGSRGIAANGANHKLYVTTSSGVKIFRIIVQHTLDVTVDGNGTVSADHGPVRDCTSSSGTCTGGYDESDTVPLQATPDSGWQFDGWSGACSGTGACSVTMDADKSVTATFSEIPNQTLNVNKGGSGSGSITSSPAGIDCGATCSAPFQEGTLIALTATPDEHSQFTGWSGGGCSGTDPCQVELDADTTVTATFDKIQHTLSVTTAGAGSGSVTSSPGGIDCGSTCRGAFDEGVIVTLTAAASSGSTFAGWSGGGCSGTGACRVSVAADTAVTATFDKSAQPPPRRTCETDPSLCPKVDGVLKLDKAVAVVTGGKALVKLSCNGDTACAGKLRIVAKVRVAARRHGKHKARRAKARTKTVVVGKASYDIAGDASAAVKVRLTRAGRKLLAHSRGHRLATTITATGLRHRLVLKERVVRKHKSRQRHARRG